MNRFSQLGSGTNSSRSEGESVDGSETSTPTSLSLLEKRLTSESERGILSFNSAKPMNTMNGPVTSTPAASTSSGSSTVVTRSPSSATAHRGPYMRPSFLDQRPNTSRFSPYSRKPIFVGAKKVTDEDSIEPHLTSTAQRMIDILQRNSTPVVEGLRKTPLHSTTIKKVKPIVNTMRSGPPITRNPLALDRGHPPLPVLPSYLLPNKVPAPQPSSVVQLPPPTVKTSPFSQIPFSKVSLTTSTLSEFSYDDESKSTGGGKMKGKTSRVHETVLRSSQIEPLTTLKEIKPLAPQLAKVTLPTLPQVTLPHQRQTTKPLQQPPPEARYTFSPALPLKSIGKSLPNGLPEESEFWKGLIAAVRGYTPVPAKTTVLPAVSTLASSPAVLSSLPPLTAMTPKDTWPCPVCMIHNKMTETKCVCCKEPQPGPASATNSNVEPVQTKAPPSKWSCPSCLVDNKMGDPSCVCCDEPRPAKFSGMVESSSSATLTKNEPAPAAFKFGFTASTTASVVPPTSSTVLSGFSFAAPKTTATEPSISNFKFGIATSASDSVPTGFKGNSSLSDSTATTGFKFGVSQSTTTMTTAKDSVPAFKFGIAAPAPPISSPGDLTVPATSTSTAKPVEKSPLSVSAFRKGFGFSSNSSNDDAETKKNGKTVQVTKFPTFPSPPKVVDKIDTDVGAEIAKYNFPLFSGGPKPTLQPPTLPPETKLPGFSFTAPTATVSSAQTPISFGGTPTAAMTNLTSSHQPTPTPFVNGITTSDHKQNMSDLLKKPPAAPFSFGLSSSTTATTTAAPAPPSTGGFSFGISTSTTTTTSTTPATATVPPAIGGFTFGIPTPSATTTTSAPATSNVSSPTFSFGAAVVPPAATTTTAALSQPVFTFGQGESHKRKAPSSTEGGGGFQFNPVEPKLKMRQAEPPTVGFGGAIKTGSFLDAMKQPGFGSVPSIDKPDGQIRSQQPTGIPFGTNFGSGGFNNPNAGFQFNAMNAAPPPVSQPAPLTGNPTPGFNFGAPPTAPTLNTNAFNFGGTPQPSTTPQFNLVPNFAFGQNAGTPSAAPVLFSAGASPTTQGADGRRPTKRGVRRLR